MATFYLIFVLLGILVVIISSLVKVPTAHYGVETLFGKRTGTSVLYERKNGC